MTKKWKKSIGMFFLTLVLAFGMLGCSTEKLDQQENQTAQAQKEETEEKENKEEATEKQKIEETEDEYFDVDSVESDVDYSKYEEKEAKQKESDQTEQNASKEQASEQNSTQTEEKKEAETTGSTETTGTTENTGVPEREQNGNVIISDGTETKSDQYETDPVPEGQQMPVEPGDIEIDTSADKTCYLTISCSTILDNMDQLTPGKEVLVPADGVLYARKAVTFYEGESVFDVLQRETRNNRIHMESNFTPMYNSAYIKGIGNLYEFDCGDNSGWMYCVNGWYPNYGVSRYVVQDQDEIVFNYTCDLGRDLGQDWMG